MLSGQDQSIPAAERPVEYSLTVRGRRLVREITRLRHEAGLSLDVASQRLDFSKSKLYRLETGAAASPPTTSKTCSTCTASRHRSAKR
jgi:hypothetical protein